MVLVANGAEGELEVNPAALEILRGVAQLVVVVAIVGLYHTGKVLAGRHHPVAHQGHLDVVPACHGVPRRCSGAAPHKARQDSGEVSFL
ncbi:unnamed protein product [Lepidochelys kempii]